MRTEREDLQRGTLSSSGIERELTGGGEGCDCSCRAVDTSGQTVPSDLLLENKAQLACSTCCESNELVDAMAPFLPKNTRETVGGKACNEPKGLLSVFLQPTCWTVAAGEACDFPFIVGYNQVVVDCTLTGETKPWCVYDHDAWNERGEGWGYCAPKSSDQGTTDPPSSSSSQQPESENLDKILANLTETQEASLSANEKDLYSTVKTSGGLTPAGIAVVTVICVLIVGIMVLTGFVIWKLRSRIKQRRQQAFHEMDKPRSPGGGQNQGEVAMNPL
ncbi:fibronectin type-II domain-containing protein [Chloropicon primus]|nr:fibronectin type-II domain-containing protein [Chloropicon primus]